MQVHVGEHLVPPVHHHGQAADQLHQQGQGHAQVCSTGQRAFPLVPSVRAPDSAETETCFLGCFNKIRFSKFEYGYQNNTEFSADFKTVTCSKNGFPFLT